MKRFIESLPPFLSVNALTRIFHPSLLRKPGTPMAAALVPAFAGMSSMHAYCSTLYSKPALPHQPSRLSRHEIDEIFGVTFQPKQIYKVKAIFLSSSIDSLTSHYY